MHYDVIVIGGGHAGIEAALAAAGMGAKTLMVTILVEQIGASSCNPAIGGLAKGHLVRELDALGGQMALTTDKTGLQFRTLNASKGPAVRGTRAQIDMDAYRNEMRRIVLDMPNLEVKQEIVEDLILEEGKAAGILTQLGNRYYAKRTIIASGTFLNGLIHIGTHTQEAGRQGEFASTALAQRLRALNLRIGRLKTGTCPRIDAKSVDVSVMEVQGGDIPAPAFSFRTDKRTFAPDQLPCYITYTNEATHRFIESNFDKAPLFTGQIEGVGPRYCPSIEDKVYRFKERKRHQIFVEPQTRQANEYYINGLSTSLPPEIQIKMVQSIKGFEKARIVRFGYAIEYDFIDPTELTHTLEVKKIPHLYMAGQVNGTTGYEEAAVQGFVAGVNAVFSIGGEAPFVIGRDEGYIGVLIDDLVTKGTNEPYRMFTSRAEYRLLLREDSADRRLLRHAKRIGILPKEQVAKVEAKAKAIEEAMHYLTTHSATPTKEFVATLEQLGLQKINDKTLWVDVIARGGIDKTKFLKLLPRFEVHDDEVIEQILIEAKYYRYIQKQQAQIEQMHQMYRVKIPKDFDFASVHGLSHEAVEKLQKANPPTLFEASRISGITPASLEILHVYIKMRQKASTK